MNRKICRIAVKVLLVAAALVLAGAIAVAAMQAFGKNRLYNRNMGAEPDMSLEGLQGQEQAAGADDWQEGDVRYQGVHYRYNEDVLTFLFLGIDKLTEVEPVENGIDGGQSDAVFLLVLNPHSMEAAIIAVPRDTMTEIDVYGKQGSYIGTTTAQLTLQHGYGDGAGVSCERSREAVSKLFYNLPIHGYCAINMGAIPLLNDAVGGVDVQALEDVVYTKIKEGDMVHLEGMEAYNYLHNRDPDSEGSNGRRFQRQKQYLTAYVAAAMEAVKKDITLPVTLYNTLSRYMVTDITIDEVSYLAAQAAGYHFGSENIYSLAGETVMGEQFEEFYADEAALYELILEVFYEEIPDKT